MRSTALGLGLLLLACPNLPNPQQPPTGCGPSSCTGCCDRDGVCQVGLATGACGKQGTQCTPCGVGLSCNAGVCSSTGGTGGGTSGTGGSTGTLGQELVSGTRLRAIYHHGEDGSKAPAFAAVFWDTQLNTYCFPYYTTQRCVPLRTLQESGDRSVYANATCTDSVIDSIESDFATFAADAGLPTGEAFFTMNDGGVRTAVPAGMAWSMTGGSCVPDTSGRAYFVPGTVVSPDAFARMPLRRE